jgi:hypothetical protein
MSKKTVVPVALVVGAGALAAASPASAEVGDIVFIEIDDVNVVQDGEAAIARGQVGCDRDLTFGMGVKVTQNSPDTDFESEQNSDSEGVTVSGPGREQLQDDQPCEDTEDDPSGSAFDVLVQVNDDSDAFDQGATAGVQIGMGTQSAGAPDPFVGDLEFESTETNTV